MGKITVIQVHNGKVVKIKVLPKSTLFEEYNKMVEDEEQQTETAETSFTNQNLDDMQTAESSVDVDQIHADKLVFTKIGLFLLKIKRILRRLYIIC